MKVIFLGSLVTETTTATDQAVVAGNAQLLRLRAAFHTSPLF